MAEHLHEGGATDAGGPLSIKTFMSRVMRSAALRTGGELEVLTASALIRGRPAEESVVGDLWHRTREEIAGERHESDSRLPQATGGDFLELRDVRVNALSAPDRVMRLGRLVLFTEEIVGLQTTAVPDDLAH